SVLAPAVGVDFVDQGRHRLGRGKLRNAMPEIEHVASVADWPKVVDDPTCLGTNGCLATEQGHGIDIALQGDLVFDPAASLGKVDSPVQTDGIAATSRDVFYPLPAPFCEDDDRHPTPFTLAGQALNHLLNIGQREFLVQAVGQYAAPTIEDHHGLCASLNLGIEVQSRSLSIDVQHPMDEVGPGVKHALDKTVVAGTLSFDHIATDSPGTARETDQGHLAIELFANERHSVKHILQLRHIGNRKLEDFVFAAHRMRESGTFASDKVEAQAHGMGHRKDVREKDSRIQLEARQRL